MIINNNQTPDVSSLNLEKPNLGKTQNSSATAGTSASTSSTTASTPGDDTISLSNSPNLVQQALNSASSARLARVQELKALVQSNQYQPDAQEVSSALVDAHLTGA
jgi:flagellar biosynthesis anti-sigma factor FlgM